MSSLFRTQLQLLRPALRSRSLQTTAARLSAKKPITSPPIAAREYTIAAAFSGTAAALGALWYYSQPPLLCESPIVEEVDPPSEFLKATGKAIRKEGQKPLWNRDEVTVVVVIGGPRAGKTEQVERIAKTFDMQVENADSDLYTDIALNIPTAHLSSPTGSSQLRVVLDSPFTTSDPLAEAQWLESTIAPILLFLFVDCPLEDAMKRGGPTGELKKEYDDWVQKFGPLIKHYRLQGNFLEITGQWPADEQWEQVYAKLESAFELEARNEL